MKSPFELLMLVCFGVSWPVNIVKSLRSRSTKGKSLLFLIIVDIGYVFGILHKLIYSRDAVIYVYILNLLMVSTDIVLYFRNKAWENRQHKSA